MTFTAPATSHSRPLVVLQTYTPLRDNLHPGVLRFAILSATSTASTFLFRLSLSLFPAMSLRFNFEF